MVLGRWNHVPAFGLASGPPVALERERKNTNSIHLGQVKMTGVQVCLPTVILPKRCRTAGQRGVP